MISTLKEKRERGARRVTESYAGFQRVELDIIELVRDNEKKGREEETYSQATFVEPACSGCAQ
jgi:hypothetical protein